MKTLGYSPWGNQDYIAPFDELFDQKKNVFEAGMSGIDALILWGGTDIHPSYYGQKHNMFSGAPPNPSVRDEFEWQAMKYCKANNIPIIGVCRGAQFLCAFAGGRLIQHVTNHGSDHLMVTSEGEFIKTTSSHHQMLDVAGTNHEMLAWSKINYSKLYYGEINKTPDHIDPKAFVEPEVVFFTDVKGLAIQGHPEWASRGSRYVGYCLELVQDKLFNEVWV